MQINYQPLAQKDLNTQGTDISYFQVGSVQKFDFNHNVPPIFSVGFGGQTSL